MVPPTDQERASLPEMEALDGYRPLSKPICAKEDRNGLSSTNKGFLQLSPEAAMLFTPFWCTHPPPPVLPFLLAHNLYPKKTLHQVTSQADSCNERYMHLSHIIGQSSSAVCVCVLFCNLRCYD